MDDVFALKGNEKLYDVLGVTKEASQGQIKRAYHKLAIQCHPDKSSDPKDQERFKEISFAYNILSDEEQRKLYDNKTLRTHLEGHKKEYDPMMDPDVELSQEDLCKFVEKIRKEHEGKAQQRQEFEDKRRAEMERRAEYDRMHPEFQMPDLGPTRRPHQQPAEMHPSMAENAAAMQQTHLNHRTTADIKEALQRLEGNTQKESDDPLAHLRPAGGSSQSSGSKAAMMAQFRSSRRENGMSTVEQTVSVQPEQVAHLDDQKYGFIKQSTSKPNYVKEVSEKVEKRSNFNYKGFIQKDMVDGGVVGDAILADALGDYDPNRRK